MKIQFLNDPSDCDWLRDTALKGCPLPSGYVFNSFVIYGNEDCPERVDLYESADPLYTDTYKRVDFGADDYCVISDVKGA